MILIDVFTKNIIYEGKTTINNIFVILSLNWFNIKNFSQKKCIQQKLHKICFITEELYLWLHLFTGM